MSSRELPRDILNKNLYLQQQKDFQNLIINGNNPNCFIVKNLESSWGKSTFALNTLPLYIQKNPNKRVLWVAERIEQCTKNAEDVNKLFGTELAGAIIGGMKSEQRKQYLQDYDIIFITHERYKRLSRLYNKDEQNLYTENRHLLIIDEKIEMCKEIQFSLTKNVLLQNDIYKLGGQKALDIYNKITESLAVSLESSLKKSVIGNRSTLSYTTDISYIDSLILQFENVMNSKVKNKSIFYQNYEDNNFQTILEKVEDLREFYNGKSIEYYDKDSKQIVMSVPNYSMQMWTLENNIILDATASIDKSYSYNTQLFNITNDNNVFNHKYWTLEWANVNSTTYGRSIYENYKDSFNKLVEGLGENETLVFAKKYDDVRPISPNSKELEKVNKFKGIVTHKGVINSNNEFENMKNAINSDSNYEDEKSYVLKYLYYSGEPITNWRRNRNGFNNKDLEDFKIYEMARGLYQFFKRVNRNMTLNSHLVLLTHKQEIVDIIVNMLKGINFKHSTEIEEMFIKKKPTKVELFKAMCNELLEGTIPNSILEVLNQDKFLKEKENVSNGKIRKSIFATALNMSETSFRNNILNKKDENGKLIKEFLKENNFEIEYQSIILKKAYFFI